MVLKRAEQSGLINPECRVGQVARKYGRIRVRVVARLADGNRQIPGAQFHTFVPDHAAHRQIASRRPHEQM